MLIEVSGSASGVLLLKIPCQCVRLRHECDLLVDKLSILLHSKTIEFLLVSENGALENYPQRCSVILFDMYCWSWSLSLLFRDFCG